MVFCVIALLAISAGTALPNFFLLLPFWAQKLDPSQLILHPPKSLFIQVNKTWKGSYFYTRL